VSSRADIVDLHLDSENQRHDFVDEVNNYMTLDDPLSGPLATEPSGNSDRIVDNYFDMSNFGPWLCNNCGTAWRLQRERYRESSRQRRRVGTRCQVGVGISIAAGLVRRPESNSESRMTGEMVHQTTDLEMLPESLKIECSQ